MVEQDHFRCAESGQERFDLLSFEKRSTKKKKRHVTCKMPCSFVFVLLQPAASAAVMAAAKCSWCSGSNDIDVVEASDVLNDYALNPGSPRLSGLLSHGALWQHSVAALLK